LRLRVAASDRDMTRAYTELVSLRRQLGPGNGSWAGESRSLYRRRRASRPLQRADAVGAPESDWWPQVR